MCVGMVFIASTPLGSILTPLAETIFPSSSLSTIPKKGFLGLSEMKNFMHLSNTYFK